MNVIHADRDWLVPIEWTPIPWSIQDSTTGHRCESRSPTHGLNCGRRLRHDGVCVGQTYNGEMMRYWMWW